MAPNKKESTGMKKKSQVELPIPSEEAPPASQPVLPTSLSLETTFWSVTDATPGHVGAVLDVQGQFQVPRAELEQALANASNRIAQETVDLEAKVRASAAYKEWRTRFDRHAETHAVNETHLASVRSALDVIADAKGPEKLQAARVAADNEAIGQQLRTALEGLRLSEDAAAKAVQVECTRLAEERFKEIAGTMQAEHDRCGGLLQNARQNIAEVVEFNHVRSYLGTTAWISSEARKIAFKLLGRLPLTPDLEPPRSQPLNMPLSAQAPGYAPGMQALFAQQKSA
jgi:hypothetical protein